MHVYQDVVVRGIDPDASELSRPGNCELVFVMNEAPPQEWRELFRKVCHDGAHAALEHGVFRAGSLAVSAPLVNALHVAETLASVVRETNSAFRDAYGEALRDQQKFADIVQEIQRIFVR
ncbi:MAG TPA: hypothetical protein VF832_02565 [Longimicrobiales bacterium]